MTTELTRTDLEECRAVIRVHSKSFHAASLLLPNGIRDAAVATYAFCRGADDDVDDASDDSEAAARHAATRARLELIYCGARMPTAVGRAFAWVVHTFQIPKSEPSALLDGMAQDLGEVRISDEDALLAYCYRAAGVVGLMMSRIMGRSDAVALRRAVDLGIAMQLTNIARDVGEDARRNRVYLPATWLHEADSSVEEVLQARITPGIRRVTTRLLLLAERYYESGIDGIALLPRACRPAILAAALIYRAIGIKVLSRHGDGVTSRARVGGLHKLGLAITAVARCLVDPRLKRREVGPHDRSLHAGLKRTGLAP